MHVNNVFCQSGELSPEMVTWEPNPPLQHFSIPSENYHLNVKCTVSFLFLKNPLSSNKQRIESWVLFVFPSFFPFFHLSL